MPIQYPNFGNIPQVKPDYSGIVDFIPQALASMRAPFQMQEERQKNLGEIDKRAFENALLKQYGEQEKQADIAQKLAYAKYMNMGGTGGAGTALARAIAERNMAAQQFGEDSPQTKMYDQYLKKVSGEQTQIPAAVRTQQINAEGARRARLYLQNIVEIPKEFLGKAGEYRLRSLEHKYETTTDPKEKEDAKEKLIHLALANKLVPDYAIDILASQSSKLTEAAKKHQSASIMQGWPASLRLEVPNLPPEILEEANKRHNQTMEKVGGLRTEYFNEIMNNAVAKTPVKPYNKEDKKEAITNITKEFKVPMDVAKDILETSIEENMSIEEVFKKVEKKLREKGRI